MPDDSGLTTGISLREDDGEIAVELFRIAPPDGWRELERIRMTHLEMRRLADLLITAVSAWDDPRRHPAASPPSGGRRNSGRQQR